MHEANRQVWKYCEDKYHKYFHGPNSIIECGSHDVSGVVRQNFSGYKEYVGVDWRAGECVDLVSLIHQIPESYHGRFDTVISSSLLEHDPYWVETILKIMKLCNENGIILLSWGAMLNPAHKCDHAVDCEFHPLSPKKVIFVLEANDFYIHEFGYEKKFGGGFGEVYLVAFKNKENAIGERIIEDFVKEDDLELTKGEYKRFKGKEYTVKPVEFTTDLKTRMKEKYRKPRN